MNEQDNEQKKPMTPEELHLNAFMRPLAEFAMIVNKRLVAIEKNLEINDDKFGKITLDEMYNKLLQEAEAEKTTLKDYMKNEGNGDAQA